MANNIYSSVLLVINSGSYNAEKLEQKINALWLSEQLTDDERNELIQAAYDNCRDMNQIDIMAKLTEIQGSLFDLNRRVFDLEHADDPEPEPAPEYPIYEAGYVTPRNGIVRFDYDNDGEYDLLQYRGGRAETSLSPGKVTGWYVIDEEGNDLGTYYKGQFTPVEPEPSPEPEEEPTPEPEPEDNGEG